MYKSIHVTTTGYSGSNFETDVNQAISSLPNSATIISVCYQHTAYPIEDKADDSLIEKTYQRDDLFSALIVYQD